MLIAVPVAALVLVAAGCGGGSTDSASESTATVEAVDTSANTDTAATDTSASTDTSAMTDTTATDTGGTDTSSATDTGATATTTSGGDASFAGCPQLEGLSKKYAQILGAATTGNGKTDFQAIAKAYKSLAEEVPEAIRPAFRTLAEAFTSYAEAFKGIDLSSGKTPDAATLAKIASATKSLDNKKLSAATAEIEAWAQKNCKS
jgi:hypothetical protein